MPPKTYSLARQAGYAHSIGVALIFFYIAANSYEASRYIFGALFSLMAFLAVITIPKQKQKIVAMARNDILPHVFFAMQLLGAGLSLRAFMEGRLGGAIDAMVLMPGTVMIVVGLPTLFWLTRGAGSSGA